MFEKILICLDGSRLAEQALPVATESCPPLKSEVVLFQVVTSNITISSPQSIYIPPLGGKIDSGSIPVSDMAGEFAVESGVGSQLAEIERQQDVNQRYLEKLAHQLRIKGIKVTTVISHGEQIGETIMHWAEKHGVTLIALTSHGQGGLEKTGFGRVAGEVLKGSEIPILIVKPKSF
jgi:nucleotide-binding universal stress UspA family protein